jgi:hypothetical protein
LNTGSVTDTATLSGSTTGATGAITISVYSGSDSTACVAGNFVTSKTTSPATSGDGSNYSATFSGLAAGSYEFQASYAGDAKNKPASSLCGTEPLTVQNQPTVTTSLSASSILNTGSVTDTATLSGSTTGATGAITISVYSGSDSTACMGTLVTSAVASPATAGDGAYSATFSGLAAGNYEFQASYVGDAKNLPASSVCGTEPLTVQNQPTVTTTLSASSVDVGSKVSDSATLSGATGSAGGTVTYTVYSDPTCMGSAPYLDGGTVPVTGGVVPPSNVLEFDFAGTYYWQASYSGDTFNKPATSACTSETLVVNPKQPGESTAQSLIPNDSFTLSGGFNPTGTITFNLYSPADSSCSRTPALTQQVNVNGNGTYSTSNTTFTATAEGTWRWQSSYSGDGPGGNNLPVTSTCGTEQFTIANH